MHCYVVHGLDDLGIIFGLIFENSVTEIVPASENSMRFICLEQNCPSYIYLPTTSPLI